MCLYKIIKKFDPYYSDDDTYGYKIFIYKKILYLRHIHLENIVLVVGIMMKKIQILMF